MHQQQDTIYEASDDAALFDRYGQTILAYVRLHTSSREDAEDIALEVFTSALENANLAAINEEEQLAWLRRVAHNKLVDSYRRVSRHPVTPLEPFVEILTNDEQETPEALMLRHETYEQLHQHVNQLSTIQQQILRLRYGEGLRFAEIAILVNKREEAVRKLLSRTLTTLRAIYSSQAMKGEQ